jgi:phage terminase Nu1 subunit (DNA packaging protein)
MATSAAAAKHIFISTSRFRDLVAGGVITHQANGKYDLAVVREEYIRNLQKVSAGRGGDGGAGLAKQRTRLESARTESVELKNAIARAEFVSLAAVQRVVEDQYSVVRERTLSTPGKCADRLTSYCAEDRGRIVEILMEEARDALTDLSTDSFMNAKLSEARARGKADTEAAEVAS